MIGVGVGNVEIVTEDGALGHGAGAPYDRAIITAVTWDSPAMLFEQVSDGGRVLVPVELRDGSGCEVTVLCRQGAVLIANQPGTLPLWNEVCGEPNVRCGLPLGALPGGGPVPIAAQFRAFLGRTETGMAAFTAGADAGWTP